MFQVYMFTLVVKLLQLNHSMSILTKISELTQVLYEICQVSKIPFIRKVEIFFKRKKQNKLFMCNTFIKIKNKTLKTNKYDMNFYLFI